MNPFHMLPTKFCFSLMLAGIVFSNSPLHAWVKVGETAPTFSLKDLQGKAHSLAVGKITQITVLYFFDVDSQSSREGIINLSLLQQKHKSALRVLAISGSSKEKLSSFAKETGIRFPLLFDDGKVRSLYNAKLILPVVCAIGSDRKVLVYHQGGGSSLQIMLGQVSEKIKQWAKPDTDKTPDKLVLPKDQKKPLNPSVTQNSRPKDLPRTKPRHELLRPPPVKIIASKTVYRSGDLISMKISTSEDNFLSLFHVAADNSVTILLPNQLQHYYFLKATEPLTFPFEGIELRAAATPGKKKETETFIAVATLQPFDFEKKFPQDKTILRADLERVLAAIPEHEKSVVMTSYDVIE